MMKFLYLETKKLFKKPSMSMASFFFNARGDYLERSISGMYRSLLLQLLYEFPDLQSVLDNTDIVPRKQQDCPDLNALKDLLSNAVMALGQRCFACFVDALDECDELDPGYEDLAQYVKSKLRIDDPLLLADLQSQTLGKASGIFMWIVLVVEILNKEHDDGGLALRTKLSEIPAKLSDLFKSILTRDQESPERLLLCVLWILCAQRPLSPAEFHHALWVALQKNQEVDSKLPDVKHMDEYGKLVTSSSKGLAEITKSEQPIVQFVHESAIVNGPEARAARDRLAQKYSFLKYASQHVLHHADAAALVVPQADFLSQFFASAGIGVLNFFKGYIARRYGVHATPLYVFADKGLENLIRTQMEQESAENKSAAYHPGERYEYPFFAALANSHKGAVAALLGLPSTNHDDVDITEGFEGRYYLMDYEGLTPLSWAAKRVD
ncbi:hypothetical protein NEMBOFW57_009485 [Staphylotrichum longicolle]|uniref:Nephrocystin 3-like N-terminal domain-containing protein n=1 Tax=Staphylotrichum longicolle TaxID=669026 RepID=A0AAD4EPJ6_9PEZI|nr:hypothetical protein NEMBOFW57_009485 [Staphylotrichum longicolle]